MENTPPPEPPPGPGGEATTTCVTMDRMSWVTNMMLSVDYGDHAGLTAVSEWLRTAAPRREQPGANGVGYLCDTTGRDSLWGGWKYPECNVWAGALNHANIPAVLDRVASEPWQVPAAVQLFLMDQEESYFRLWMLRDGNLQQYAPPPPPDDSA